MVNEFQFQKFCYSLKLAGNRIHKKIGIERFAANELNLLSEVEWTIVIVLILNGKLHDNLAEFELKLEFTDWDKVEHL